MTISNKRVRALPLVLFVIASVPFVAVPREALAQSASDLASARALYKEARELRDKGDPKGALEKFKAANALAGTPITALELGRTHAQVGQPVEALEAWLSVARMKEQPNESENAKAARAEAASLAQQIASRVPSLVVKVEGAPPGSTLQVMVDGAPIPVETLGQPRKLNPGEHSVVVRTSTGREEKRAVTLKEGESQAVSVSLGEGAAPAPAVVPVVVAPPPAEKKTEPAPKPASTEKNKTNPIVYVGFGVGAAGIVVGTLGGILTFSNKSDLKPLCDGLVCDSSARKIVSTARTWATVSTIGFVVGGVGIAAGVVGLLMPTKEIVVAPGVKAHLVLDPGSVGLAGSF